MHFIIEYDMINNHRLYASDECIIVFDLIRLYLIKCVYAQFINHKH